MPPLPESRMIIGTCKKGLTFPNPTQVQFEMLILDFVVYGINAVKGKNLHNMI